jgi:PST family polysaccharide transporter
VGAWIAAVATGFVPLWYFQGMERLRGPALLDIGVRLASNVGIFFWVTRSTGWRVLALQAAGSLVSVAVTNAWMYRSVPFLRPRVRAALDTLRSGWPLFVFVSAASVYTVANSFLLGLLVGTGAVGFFGAGDKIVRAGMSLFGPLSQAMYPRINQLVGRDVSHADRVLRRTLVPFVGMGVALAAVVAIGAPLIVRVLLGPQYGPAVTVLRILALLPPLIGFGTVVGIHWAIPLGLDRSYNRFVLTAGVVNLVLALVLVPRYGAVGMASAAVMAETVVESGLAWLYVRHLLRVRLRPLPVGSEARA